MDAHGLTGVRIDLRVKLVVIVGLLSAGLIAACGAGSDGPQSSPEPVTDDESELKSEAIASSQNDDAYRYPGHLDPIPGDATEPSPDAELSAAVPPVGNGSIVVGSSQGWTAYDENLVELSSGLLEVVGEDLLVVEAAPWPNVFIGSAYDVGDHFVNVETGRQALIDGFFTYTRRSRWPVRRYGVWVGMQAAPPLLVDYETLGHQPIPLAMQLGSPQPSPNGQLVVVSATDQERERIDIRPTSEPSSVIWSYPLPAGLRIVDETVFDEAGRIIVIGIHSEASESVAYRGLPGEPLELIEMGQLLSERYPGIPIQPDGVNAVITTIDGEDIPVGGHGKAQPVCEATGWDVVVRSGEVLFFGQDLEVEATASIAPGSLFEVVEFGGLWLLGARFPEGNKVLGYLDCETREVLSPTELGDVFGVGQALVFDRGVAGPASNGYELAILGGEQAEGVIISAADAGLLLALRSWEIHDASLAPDGSALAAIQTIDGERRAIVVPLSLTEPVDEFPMIFDDEARSLAWLLTTENP